MTPGPTIFRKYSACSKAIEQDTIGSGNTFGATFWIDGKREALMLPDQHWLVMCPHCHEPCGLMNWLNSAKLTLGNKGMSSSEMLFHIFRRFLRITSRCWKRA